MNIFRTPEQHPQIRALKIAAAVTEAEWSRLLKKQQGRREEALAWKQAQWLIDELEHMSSSNLTTKAKGKAELKLERATLTLRKGH